MSGSIIIEYSAPKPIISVNIMSNAPVHKAIGASVRATDRPIIISSSSDIADGSEFKGSNRSSSSQQDSAPANEDDEDENAESAWESESLYADALDGMLGHEQSQECK